MLRMKALSLSLLIFAMVILLSSALPGKEKDKSSKLVVSEDPGEAGKPLKRKPPIKTPGPKLTGEHDLDSSSELSKMESFSGDKKGGKKHLTSNNGKEKNDSAPLVSSNDNNKRKKHVIKRGAYNGDSKEETEERSTIF